MADAPTAGSVRPPGAAAPTVFVVERSQSSVLLAAATEAVYALSNGADYEVATFASPDAAVTALSASRPACLLLDAALPPEDVADVLKAAQATAPGLPILILEPVLSQPSAIYADLRDRCAAETVYTAAQVMERLTLHLLTGAPRPSEPELPRFRSEKVLIVDDDIRSVFALTSALELQGLSVVYAASGMDGIATLERDEEIRAVLMDIAMPGLDGYATAARIRELERFGAVPIIAVTVDASPADRAKSLAAGMDEHVPKPVDVGLLLGMLRELIG